MTVHLQEAKVEVSVPIPPALLTEPKVAIEIFFNNMLLTHVPALSGVALSYSDLKLVDQLGKIVDGSPLIHVRVRAKILVCRLQESQTIRCTVTSLSSEFIGLNFLDVFQVSVLARDIDSYVCDSRSWKSKATGAELTLGENIAVIVNSLVTTEGHLAIHGVLK